MAYTIERIKDSSTILITLLEGHSADEIPQIHQETMQMAGQITGQVHRIVDMRQAGFTFSQVVMALKEGAAKREGGAADQRFKSYYVVGDNNMSRLLAESLGQSQYGQLHVEVLATVEDALKVIHSN